MSDNKVFYITTTLPYVNSTPHMGHALEIVRADSMARYKKNNGFDVFFNTGTDEHGEKVYKKALEEKKDIQKYVDEVSSNFKILLGKLGIMNEVNFIRTTDEKHIHAAKEFWKICDTNGFIYKEKYSTKYCIGCELEKTDSELVNGCCPIHPDLPIELHDEENYFFKFSAFGERLLKFYEAHENFVIPDGRFNEIKSFVKGGLHDFSISRLKEKMPWGIEIPGDEKQVMYVWFDALVNYIAAIGWPTEMNKFKTWQIETGGMVQYCGKDNLRQQSAMWQAMLMAAELPNSKNIIIDGFVTGEGGVKMSKSIGNVIDPIELINEYGTDAVRYYCLRELNPFEDTPMTKEMFHNAYNASLANGLGNLVSRVMTMAQNNFENPISVTHINQLQENYIEAIEKYNFQEALNIMWKKIAELDERIQKTEPFKLIKTEREIAMNIIRDLVVGVYHIAIHLEPFLPETAEKIKKLVLENKKPETPLFLRKN